MNDRTRELLDMWFADNPDAFPRFKSIVDKMWDRGRRSISGEEMKMRARYNNITTNAMHGFCIDYMDITDREHLFYDIRPEHEKVNKVAPGHWDAKFKALGRPGLVPVVAKMRELNADNYLAAAAVRDDGIPVNAPWTPRIGTVILTEPGYEDIRHLVRRKRKAA